MLVRKLPTIAITVVAICFSGGAFAVDGGRPRHTMSQTARWSRPTTTLKSPVRAMHWKQRAARTPAADRDPYADPVAPYRANRLSSPPGQPMVNIPSQTAVITRRVLDDKNATSVRNALRTTPGVTIGR
jgi:outer membrane receptor for monomeric catechols